MQLAAFAYLAKALASSRLVVIVMVTGHCHNAGDFEPEQEQGSDAGADKGKDLADDVPGDPGREDAAAAANSLEDGPPESESSQNDGSESDESGSKGRQSEDTEDSESEGNSSRKRTRCDYS